MNDTWLPHVATHADADVPFLLACRREHTPYTPVWLMRQAGRYLPEYRRVREQLGFLELCRRSELAAEVTASTVRRLGVDAAIIFADILLPLIPMGLDLRYAKGDGPIIDTPLRENRDLDRLSSGSVVDELGYVAETVRLTRRDLGSRIPIIGFAGAPFTLASYAIEGRGSRNYVHVKTLMYRDPHTWNRLMNYVVDMTVAYLNMQIDAGADAVQLFDSWVGALSPLDYVTYVQPYMRQLIARLRPDTPVILFGTMTGSLLPLMRETGADVIGLDWRVEISESWQLLGRDVAVQGNLDPVCLFADRAYVQREAHRILTTVGNRTGHIFNLGHGVLPETPVDNVLALIDAVHTHDRR